MHLNAIALGASQSDYPNVSGREYDYGPGASTRLWLAERHYERFENVSVRFPQTRLFATWAL